MKIIEKIKSNIDNTVKYIIQLEDGLITEVSYIYRNDDKDIICISSHTGCNMGCMFCHITEIASSIKTRPLDCDELIEIINTIYSEIEKHKTLVISFMDAGEPFLNIANVCICINYIARRNSNSTFAISTIFPRIESIERKGRFLIDCVNLPKTNVKLHLSLHATEYYTRKRLLPSSSIIHDSIEYLVKYKKETGNKTEIHYTLIENINDSEKDIERLIDWLKNKDIPVKFIAYNKNDNLKNNPTSLNKVNKFITKLEENGIKARYYIPPGQDVGSSCGQFLKEYYLKYNKL